MSNALFGLWCLRDAVLERSWINAAGAAIGLVFVGFGLCAWLERRAWRALPGDEDDDPDDPDEDEVEPDPVAPAPKEPLAVVRVN